MNLFDLSRRTSFVSLILASTTFVAPVLSSASEGGGGSVGGGHSVVCFKSAALREQVAKILVQNERLPVAERKDPLLGVKESDIQSAQLLDLWEGRELSNDANKFKTTLSADAYLKNQLEWIRANSTFYQKVGNDLAKVQKGWRTAPAGIATVHDANLRVHVPPTCLLMQAAIQEIVSGRLVVYTEPRIIKNMPAIDQAALKVHEALYYDARRLGAEDSRDVRHQVRTVMRNDLGTLSQQEFHAELNHYDAYPAELREVFGQKIAVDRYGVINSLDKKTKLRVADAEIEITYLAETTQDILVVGTGQIGAFAFTNTHLSFDRKTARLNRFPKSWRQSGSTLKILSPVNFKSISLAAGLEMSGSEERWWFAQGTDTVMQAGGFPCRLNGRSSSIFSGDYTCTLSETITHQGVLLLAGSKISVKEHKETGEYGFSGFAFVVVSNRVASSGTEGLRCSEFSVQGNALTCRANVAYSTSHGSIGIKDVRIVNGVAVSGSLQVFYDIALPASRGRTKFQRCGSLVTFDQTTGLITSCQ